MKDALSFIRLSLSAGAALVWVAFVGVVAVAGIWVGVKWFIQSGDASGYSDADLYSERLEDEVSPRVREYCEGTVSRDQELGCLSHVKPWEVP